MIGGYYDTQDDVSIRDSWLSQTQNRNGVCEGLDTERLLSCTVCVSIV